MRVVLLAAVWLGSSVAADSWRVENGNLQYSADKDTGQAIEWLRSAKAVAFLPDKPAQYTLEADIRVFPAYQDEADRIRWVWKRATGKIGIERQEHFGFVPRPNYSCNISETIFETWRPELNQWNRVRIEALQGRLKWNSVRSRIQPPAALGRKPGLDARSLLRAWSEGSESLV
jgi:hypothetical protein